jgi:molybdate transport system substrate-binding protein
MRPTAILLKMSCLVLLWGLLLLPRQLPAGEPVTLTIFAGMGLKEALNEAGRLYAKDHPSVRLQYNFASSGALQKQIEQGAPADLFISASKKQMDALTAAGMIESASRRNLVGNTLVLIASREMQGKIKGFADLPGQVARFALGHPESVPAGRYGRQTLEHLQLWPRLEQRLLMAKDVRSVMVYVDSGNADAGLVYASDTLHLRSAAVVATAPADSHEPIIFPAAVVAGSKYKKQARDFLHFLHGPEAAHIFLRHKFKPLPAN